jgi:hypothetical protein
MTEILRPEHSYDAEATAFEGNLFVPLRQEIKPQAFVKLPTTGGYLAQRSCGYRVESLLSFESAYTQVAGNRDVKPCYGFHTLTTSVVEGLNVLDVVTADRVVAQISTEHPLDGYVPSITFLGTRFENLRIAGHKIDLDLDLDLFGDKPGNDGPYTNGSTSFAGKVSEQHAHIRDRQNGYPNPLAELRERFNLAPESFENDPDGERTVECSLVNDAEGSYPGRSFGHVIHVPHFGTIYLATLRLTHSHFEERVPWKTLLELTMIDIRLGCIAEGNFTICMIKTNGMPTG